MSKLLATPARSSRKPMGALPIDRERGLHPENACLIRLFGDRAEE
jgi:hypothetical protein